MPASPLRGGGAVGALFDGARRIGEASGAGRVKAANQSGKEQSVGIAPLCPV